MSQLTHQLKGLDGIALAHLIQRRELSASELLEQVITAISTVNPALNALAEPLYEAARSQLSTLAGTPASPLAGLPILIKDLFMPVAGALMQNGSLLFKGLPAPLEAEFVGRLRRAGMVIAGTTTSPEFGTSYSTESRLWGATRNPWDTSRIAGGSSGGAAALVAARALPFAHANDGGGSIRVPASCCGVFGLKPTRGRTPIGPMVGEGWAGMGINHAVSVSVRDNAALLDIVAGEDAGAPYAAPAQPGSFLQATQQPPRRLRIGLVEHMAPWQSDADCVEAVRHAARLCETLGHEVIPITLPLDSLTFYDQVFTIIGAQTQSLMNLIALHSGQPAPIHLLDINNQIVLREKGQVSGAAYAAAVDYIHALGRSMAGVFREVDILLTPTVANVTPLLGSLTPSEGTDLAGFIEQSHSFSPFTAWCNATGLPAMSVPLYWTADQLPIGSHFVAPFGDENTLFALAAQLEQAQPWADRLPGINAYAVQG